MLSLELTNSHQTEYTINILLTSKVKNNKIRSLNTNIFFFSFSFISVPAEVCHAKVDLCLIIDSSASIRGNNPSSGNPDYALQLDFLANVVAIFPIGPDNTRVAAIVFSEEVILEFPLNRYNSIFEVQEAIRNVPYLGQTTNTPEAFRQAYIQCFNASNGDRDDADNVIIIATDGKPTPSTRRDSTLMEARRLKDKGIEIIAVGVTDRVDEDFLRGISSGNNYFKVVRFDQMEETQGPMLRQFCPSTGKRVFLPFILIFDVV